MKSALIKILLFSALSVSTVATAENCNPFTQWWPYCIDPATGPDISSDEYINCIANGGCMD
ncbi:TPA: hypothetical protein ACHJX8_004744 [Yersinia enterocolitica]|uniref:hypothetical protein n=1 Tax=Yersinia TaxID=629 RepID=UPI000AA4C090|nr:MULTISPECIES: hypothetical protein [Yersinia]HEC1651350.1 hypothetical protein [Yersinia enterocolitica]MCB5319256.1 hypothetical protein [Yersinia massiliensis]MDN0126366.1 hypothetical protein [Yersinia massiliensis]QKJ09890.1 hypothetical protein HRD68_03545 [Yersinia massiliensis]HEC1652605.1 hypothetical protein [Yersinia enterocolitica]